MDIHDPDSIAFRYLAYLHDLSSGRKGGGPINQLGWDLGLSNNEIKDVAQYLRSLGMLDLWSGSRGWRMSDLLSLRATVSEIGREHVRAIRSAAANENTH